MAIGLTPVRSVDEIRDAIAKFNDVAPTWDYARKLLRATTYWVYDPGDELFGPSKFVGFVGLDAANYDAAGSGDSEGAAFNGGLTRQAIEQTLGAGFRDDDDLSERLVMWADQFLGADLFDGIDSSKWRFLALPESLMAPGRRTKPKPRAWAFFANPKLYRIDEAIRERGDDTWVTAGRDIHRGDRVILWRGRGRDGHRGIVAFGEVVSEPRDLDDSDNPYWAEPQEPKLEPRVRVRYVHLDRLPLWLGTHDEVLSQLSVSRAKGGTVFNVTDEQWDLVIELAGGWPDALSDGAHGPLGVPYMNIGRLASSARRDPFEVDPDKVDRGNQAHATTQDALADFLRRLGLAPRSPAPGEPEFDLAWEQEGTTFVAEVKSTTGANEEKQLRLGLGQVLRYRQALSTSSRKVVAVLVAERTPEEKGWSELCRSLGVVLVWPADFIELASPPSTP